MRDLPNQQTTLIVSESYTRGKWFIHDHLHVIEQRDSSNFIACYPDDLTKKIHFRIITDVSQLRLHFHDYILVGQINQYMLDSLEDAARYMKAKYKLEMVE